MSELYETTVPGFQCLRCGHTWPRRGTKPPVTCPSCRSAYWRKLRQNQREEDVVAGWMTGQEFRDKLFGQNVAPA